MEREEKLPVTSASPGGKISTELSARRTGMSFQRTRISAERTLMSVIRTSLSLISFGFTIFQFFQKLREAGALTGSAAAPRHFGMPLVILGIVLLVVGIAYHVQFMIGLRHERAAMTTAELIYGQSRFPVSYTLIIAFLLLALGLLALASMTFDVDLFGWGGATT